MVVMSVDSWQGLFLFLCLQPCSPLKEKTLWMCQEVLLLYWWQPNSIFNLIFWNCKAHSLWSGGRTFLAASLLFPLWKDLNWSTQRYSFTLQVLPFWGEEETCQKLNINNVQWKMHMCLPWECEVMPPFLKQSELQVKGVHWAVEIYTLVSPAHR